MCGSEKVLFQFLNTDKHFAFAQPV